MRAVPLLELRALLQAPPFLSWWAEYSAALAAEREARARHAQLADQHRLAAHEAEATQRRAIDTFSAAGGADEEAARVGAEAQAHEVRALELVGRFEEQRFRTSDLWYRQGGAERQVELRREALAALSAAGPDAPKARAQAEAAVNQAERQLRALRDEYDAEDRKRSKLWDEVEAAWDRSFERSLLAAEHGTGARRIIREAEQLFKEADEKRAREKAAAEQVAEAERAVAEAVRRRATLLETARERWGCLSGEAFLYWRHPDDQHAAWAVSLREDATGWNRPVQPLEAYLVHRVRGVAFLEPAREGLPLSLEQGDRRFEEYFLGPRRGARRTDEAVEPAAEVEKP